MAEVGAVRRIDANQVDTQIGDIVDEAFFGDLAGNKIGQAFDIDVFDKVTERITQTTTSVPFEIRPAR